MVGYHLYKYKHIYVFTLSSCERTFKDLVIVASGEKFTAERDWREIPYIPCCPFYIGYHVLVLPIPIFFFIKKEVELFLLRWKNTKDILLSTKSKLQNSMNSI